MSADASSTVDSPSRYWSSIADAIERWAGPDVAVTLTAHPGAAVTVTARSKDGTMTVRRTPDWMPETIPAPLAATVSPRQLRSKMRLQVGVGWMDSAGTSFGTTVPSPGTRRPARRPAAGVPVPTAGLIHHVNAYGQFPGLDSVRMGAGYETFAVAAHSPTLTGCATIGGSLEDITAAIIMPGRLALLMAALLPTDSTVIVHIDSGRRKISVDDRTQTITYTAPPMPDPGWPEVLELPTRMHDLNITDLQAWRDRPASRGTYTGQALPQAYLRLNTVGDRQQLQVFAKLVGSNVNIALPAITSDRFAVDVPWPQLAGLLEPAGGTVALRYFDPSSTITYLSASYRYLGFTGRTTTGARRPDSRMRLLPE